MPHSPRSGRRFALVVGSFAVFVAAYVLLERVVGAAAGSLIVLPVVVTGVALGRWYGAAAGAGGVLLVYLLWYLSGVAPGDTLLRVGGPVGPALAIVVGAVVGHFRDTREEALAGHRRLAAALAKREEDVRILAREIMNPLVAIETAARVLSGAERGTLDPHGTAVLISREARAARDLVRALTDAAQIEARGLHLERRPLDLAALARETLSRFDASGREIAVDVPSGAVWVTGDRAAIQRVVRHLLANAVLYSHGGPIVVAVTRSPDGGEASLAVRDRGPAIPPEERPLLFQKFARLSTAGGTSGAGLSLWVSQAILVEHGTRLAARWPDDGGNELSFTLHACAAPSG